MRRARVPESQFLRALLGRRQRLVDLDPARQRAFEGNDLLPAQNHAVTHARPEGRLIAERSPPASRSCETDLLQRSHLPEDTGRRLREGHGQQTAGSFSQAHVQVEKR